MTGRVVAFDAHRGIGTIAAADGTQYAFHCTQIADGTRTIDVGAAVEFEIGPGLPGQWEARVIVKQ